MKPQPKIVKSWCHGVGSDCLTSDKGPVKNKYHCDEPSCEREFCSKSGLDNHRRSVHGADKLKCHDSNCPASFANSSSYYRHMWVKHDIGKGSKCDQCGKKEPSVAYLRNHQRAAHGAPKLLCKEPGCSKAFTYDLKMYEHVKKKHKQF